MQVYLNIVRHVLGYYYTRSGMKAQIRILQGMEKGLGAKLFYQIFPMVGKRVERSTEGARFNNSKRIESPLARFKWRDGYPLLFQEIWKKCYLPYGNKDLIFCEVSSAPEVAHAIKSLRQLLLYFSKQEGVVDDKTVNTCYDKYLFTDYHLSPIRTNTNTLDSIRTRIESSLRRGIEVDPVLDSYPLYSTPFFSSGALAHETGYGQKYSGRFKVGSLDANWRGNAPYIIREHIPYALTTHVPKDTKSVRIIEETDPRISATQHAVQALMYERICRDRHMDITNQETNRKLAFEGSVYRNWCTIDLSEASDRVSKYLVDLLFPKIWREAFNANRTPITLLPISLSSLIKVQGKNVRLGISRGKLPKRLGSWIEKVRKKNRIRERYAIHITKKFAGMGSALTFPIETLVFRSILCEILGIESVYAYGDDLIVPNVFYRQAIKALQDFGFKVNLNKSFYKGHFRESCGVFAWRGYDVGCVYRREESVSVAHVNRIIELWGPAAGERIYKALREIGIILPRGGFGHATALNRSDHIGHFIAEESLNLPPKAVDFVFFPWYRSGYDESHWPIQRYTRIKHSRDYGIKQVSYNLYDDLIEASCLAKAEQEYYLNERRTTRFTQESKKCVSDAFAYDHWLLKYALEEEHPYCILSERYKAFNAPYRFSNVALNGEKLFHYSGCTDRHVCELRPDEVCSAEYGLNLKSPQSKGDKRFLKRLIQKLG